MKIGLPRNVFFYVVAAIVMISAAFFFTKKKKADAYIEVPVRKGPVVQAVYGIGTVTARHTYTLKVGITATITRLYVKEGDHVSAGAPLVSLEHGTIFTAPFAGTVTSLPYKLGETIFPQAPILILTDLTELYLVVSVEQQAAVLIKRGQKASISFENMRGQAYQGVVRTVYSNAGQFLVNIDADDLPPAILPDMTADIGIQVNVHDAVLIVPSAALHQNKVSLKSGGKINDVQVAVGYIDGDNAEITSDQVHEGDIVLVPKK